MNTVSFTKSEVKSLVVFFTVVFAVAGAILVSVGAL